MRTCLILLITLVCSRSFGSELVTVKLADGEILTGKLDTPVGSEAIKELVVFVHGTGPNTYLNHRKFGKTEFNYFDLFATEFTKRGIAFFTYNRRGVSLGNKPPYYDSIDSEKYKKYLPSIEPDDLATVINQLRKQKRLKKTKVVLLGWSEGTILAAMMAEQRKTKIDAIFLAGYCNGTVIDAIKWQYSGSSSMQNIREYFDTNDDMQISQAEYESENEKASMFRKKGFKDAKFADLDVNKDNNITREDFGIIAQPRLKAIMDAYEKGDQEWIWKNYFRVTIDWLKEHDHLEPNSSRLLRIKIPIFIFHGDGDANVPLEGALDIQKRFEKEGKSNLQLFTFRNHDHNLNYAEWPQKQVISEGISKIFEVAEKIR